MTRGRSRIGLILLLGLLEAFGPLSLEFIMPALPAVQEALGASDGEAQNAMAFCVIGLGIGQLFAGPLSDRYGRRPLLLGGIALYALFSVACACTPTIEWLLLFRVLQGIGGAAGIVITLAIARDLYSGTDLSRILSGFVTVGTATLIAGPILGAALLTVADWRGSFLALGVFGGALLVLTAVWLPESHPPERRSSGRGTRLLADARALLGSREYRTVLIISAIMGAGFFSYVSMSSLVLQNDFGVAPGVFGILIALGTACNVLGLQVSAALVRRLAPLTLYRASLAVALAGGLLAGLSALLDWGLWPFVIGLWLISGAAGFRLPNQNTIALGEHGERAGSAAALLGTTGFIIGPVVSSLVSAGGVSAATLGVTVALAGLIGCTVGFIVLRRW